MTSVSFIIPAWNEERTLKATVEALLCMDYDKKMCEVIVVAGGSDSSYQIALDLTTPMAAFARYVVLRQGPHGKNAAIQQGIGSATGDITLLLDADTIVSEGCLKAMVAPIEQGACDLTVANPDPITRNWVSDYYMLTKAYLLDSITTFSGHAIAFRTSVVRDRVDYFFDRTVKVGVDYLLAKRFWEDGRKTMLARDARVKTHLASSLRYFVLTELRWLTALIKIDGVNCRTLACNTAVVVALVSAIPFCSPLFVLSVLFNTLYMAKRIRIFLAGSKRHKTNVRNMPGFLLLSYVHHAIGLVCHIKHFLGMSGRSYLYQGQRC